jgi:ribosomal protein S18 acetylase RimI-like enzyme
MFLRTANPSDDDIIQLHRSAAVAEAQKYRGTLQNAHMSGTAFSYVAGFGDTVMASLVVLIDSQSAHIDHVFVDPAAREVGLADALVQLVLTELQNKKISHVRAQALPGDRAMKNLFERHGLVAQTIFVGKNL